METNDKRNESNSESPKFHNTMKIFGSLLSAYKPGTKGAQGDQKVEEIVSLSPSEYMRQLLMTTEERMELLTKQHQAGIDGSPPINPQNCHDFEIVPNIVVFQRYCPGNIYIVTVTIRNITKTSHYLKLACENDPAFSVEYKATASLNTRLAAGMHSTYNVRFLPEENRDYDYEIKFVSDRGAFGIPVIAIGPRPILDFPDLITIPETGVKISSTKSLLVRNIGEKSAAFSISTGSSHFSLEPSKGVIEEEEIVQFEANFLSTSSGFFEECFFLTYDTGEVVRIQVQASAVNCNVRLERGSVRMQEETYLGLSTSRTVKIFNRSEYIVKYQWMKNKDEHTDDAVKEKYNKIFSLINDGEMARSMDLVHYNICTQEVHNLVCRRIYTDEIVSLTNENFLYKDTNFSLVPMEGEIWPQSSVEVTIFFEPGEIGELSSTAYLELTGHEDRIPLNLSGLSLGPCLKLNVATIDVQNIFLCSLHNYQVVCTNGGLIPGVLVHKPKPTDFGGIISVTPECIKLQPHQTSAFNLTFTSNRNGDFVERIEFIVKESLQVVAMYIKGCVVCPTLHFDKNRLDFETTALGFTSKREVMLHNDSLVPVTFGILVPDDGNETVRTHQDFVKAATKLSFPSHPREFQIIPKEGIVAAQSSLKVKIDFTPNTGRTGQTTLRVDMWNTDSVPMLLPIAFRSKVASLVVKPAEFDIHFCFLNFPYARSFTVENKSDVEGYFYIVPQSTSDSASLQYSMSTHHGYLAPGQTKTVSLTIITRAMGKQKSVISMLTFGEKQPSACCVLTCNGQGPVVSVQPTILDWGTVELLKDKTMSMTLINDSPVPAEFTATLCNKNSSWKVFPTSGDLSSGQSINFQVTILLRDVGKHLDKIVIVISNSRDISVSLSAIGIGSCIVCNPAIFPTFDMGLLFSNQDNRLPIDIKNEGSRNLKLVFSNSMEIRLIRGGQVQQPDFAKFSIEPLVIELPAQSSTKVFCNVRSDTCESISEKWWLHCFVDGQVKHEIIDSSTFTAKFIEPSISFSKKELMFRVDMGNAIDRYQAIDELLVTNESGLNLHCLLSIDGPFHLLSHDGNHVPSMNLIFEENMKLPIQVIFVATEEKENRQSKTYRGTLKIEYDEHPNVDEIKCVANVNYPNIAQLPDEIRFDCPLGCSVVENILLKNLGPLEVSYKFVWLEKSISIVYDPPNGVVEDEVCSEKAIPEADRSELLTETKEFLSDMLNMSSLRNKTDSSVTETIDDESHVTEIINQLCSIVPCHGVISAHSSQCISLIFHGEKSLKLEAHLLCEIDGGPSKLIKVFAVADEVQFCLEEDSINFGQQVIQESNQQTITLENHSKIKLTYHVELDEKFVDTLEIRPMSATVAAQSTVELEIISRPVIPDVYKNSFKLCIEHCLPLSICVEGIAIIPQVYVSLPRNDIWKNCSVELGYRAIQNVPEPLEADKTLEEDNGWQIVVANETLPSVIDIEMAIERVIANEFIQENYSAMPSKSTSSNHSEPIPYLFAPEYTLDIGYVIVGQSVETSTRVYNYGVKSVKIRLNKTSGLEKLTKQGIIIHFRDQKNLNPGEYVNLDVSYNPVRLKGSEEFFEMRRKFYLEVINGFTLPIIIMATVTYPSVTLASKFIEFDDVLVGECKLIHLPIKNEGLIDCQWVAKLPPSRRNQIDGPFRLQNTTDFFLPGQSESIKIYFKPNKSGCIESKLTVEVDHGPKPIIVELRGRGIEHKLNIVQPKIHFSAVLPHNSSMGKNFTIENVGQRAVEVYWHHLEQPDLQEDRLTRVLTHYYQVEEILLPPRCPPDSSALPAQLYDFYNSLVDEMTLSMATQRQTDTKRTFEDTDSVLDNSIEKLPPKRKGSTTRKMSRKLTRTESIVTVSDNNLSAPSNIRVDGENINDLPFDDPDEIEKLLHCYIEELHKQPDFFEKMKDPVKEVFDALKIEELQQNIPSSPEKKERKTCIIFHGASTTEYEQAACRTSRVLGIPLLNLNKAITEIIALGNTACSAKLREIIDAKYRELSIANEKLHAEDIKKILTSDELNTFDSVTRYEYKIETIQDNETRKSPSESSSRRGKGSTKSRDKSPQTPRGKIFDTFLDIDVRLYSEILEQRLAMEDLCESFVVQTLSNKFIKEDAKTLSTLLQILGHVEYPIFVTFHKSVGSRESVNPDDNPRADVITGSFEKLIQIDEMSASEFDALSNADKELYLEKVLRDRSQEALQRRIEFHRKISELRKQKDRRTRNISSDSKERNVKKRKSKILPQSSRASDRLSIHELSNKKKKLKIDSTKTTARKTVAEEIQASDVVEMDSDTLNLNSILSILQSWDPTQILIAPNSKETGQSKASKNSKKDTESASKIVEGKDRFWIWHINVNPACSMSSEGIIVDEIMRNQNLLNPKPKELLLAVQPHLRAELYSVIQSKKMTATMPRIARKIEQPAVFTIVALNYNANTSNENPFNEEAILPKRIEEPVQRRFLLEPHESREFIVYFNPRHAGVFQEEFPLMIVNSNKFYDIKVSGSGDIPHINIEPTLTFTKIKEVKKVEMNEPTFFMDTQTFDFGALLLTGKDHKVHRKKSSFKVFNPSMMDLELAISLLGDNWKTYSVEPTQLFIKANDYGVINVSAAGNKLGPNEEQLVLLVNGNPRVKLIQMRSNGTKCEMILEGKQISFGKVLLHREVTKTLTVVNNSLVPLYWRITPLDSVKPQIKFSPSRGWVKARADSKIYFTYLADRVEIMEKKKMAFQAFLDEEDHEDPVWEDIITVFGETYDVAIDISFADPIVMPTVLVGSISSASFTVKNRGSYDANFTVEFEKDEKSIMNIDRQILTNLKEDLRIVPSTGIIRPDQTATIDVNFEPKFEMKLKKASIIRCNVMDVNNAGTVVAEFPLTVSITAHYTRFRIIPNSEICFGPVSVCSSKTLHFTIENIGYFPLKYQLKSTAQLPATNEENSKKQKKDKSARTDITRHGTAKSREDPKNLRVGPFTISKSGGSIAPGVIETLKVDCYSEKEGYLEEQILVLVEESAPDERSGRSINLNVDSCSPSIDFTDLDAIFQESYIVDKVEDFECPKEIDSHTIFARLQRYLSFERIIVNKTHTATIKLYNRGIVPATVTVRLRPDALTPKNTKSTAFVLDTVQETILPMSSQVFAISFTPSLIEKYTGMLEAAVELPVHLKNDSNREFSIKLSGEGCVPEVVIIDPPPTSGKHAGKLRIGFGRSLIEDTALQNLKIANTGKVTAKVVIGIYHDRDMLYTIRTNPSYDDWTNEEASAQINRSFVCTLYPSEVACFSIEFRPNEVGRKEAEIQLHVLDNPYENSVIELDGEGFIENVVLVGLPLVGLPRSSGTDSQTRSRKTTKHRSNMSLAGFIPTSTPALVYSLDYGMCSVDKLYKINFKILNKSEAHYFRFAMSAHPNVVFVPSTGHLQRSESKDIAATFLTAAPITLQQFGLECEIYEILFENERSEVNLWDDRQESVSWIPVDFEGSFNSATYEESATKKTVVPSEEPRHEIVTGTRRTIRLMISATAAFSEYSCSVEEVNFKNTLMFQNRDYSFDLENPGTIDLFFDWKIQMDVEYPRRLVDSAFHAFKPRSLESNESRPNSRSSDGMLYPEGNKRILRYTSSRNQKGNSEYPRSSNVDHDCEPMSSQDKLYAIPIEPGACSSASASDLFSHSAALTQRSTMSWIEDNNDQPFSVQPISGVIPPGQTLQFTLRFSPMDVFDYKAYLACQIENLSGKLKPLTIPVVARSLLPYCHFDVEESDYLAKKLGSHNNFSAAGSGDSNDVMPLHVVEFRVVGIGDSHKKQFSLINPTTENYKFKWKDISSREPDDLPFFHCVYEEGLAESGKRSNIIFTFYAEETGIFESLWCFSIDKYSLQTHFLIVAIVTEPAVHFFDTRLRMKPTILGLEVEDTAVIINNENVKLPFKILPNSLRAVEENQQILNVTPMNGNLEPNCEQILQLSFVPSSIGEFSFSLLCQVKTMTRPLNITVTIKVATIIPVVQYSTDFKEHQMLEAVRDRENILNFGKLTLNKPVVKKFEITNIGDVAFHYTWNLGIEDSGDSYKLTTTRESDLVLSKSTSTCYLELIAVRKTLIRHHVTLIIGNGPMYRMFVKASAKRPSIEFSFINYDFGPCYIRDKNSPAYVTLLSVVNNDSTPAIIECDFPDNLPYMTIDVDALSEAISGNSTINLPINFRPLEQMCYNESLNFCINGSTIQQTINIRGEGVPYKINLEYPRDKLVDFGNVQLGKTVTRKIRVVNAGRASVEICFDLITELPGYEQGHRLFSACQDESAAQSKKKLRESRKSSIAVVDQGEDDSTLRDTLHIEPRMLCLPANKSVEIVVKFKPAKKINSFVEKIGAQVDSTILPLFSLRGNCIAREFRLNRSHMYFGIVVEGCSTETKIVLQNTGDFGAKFKWNDDKLKPHFDIKPISGYCSPGMEITFAVTFRPIQLASLLEAKATLDIEKYGSLRISCSGACCRIPDPIESIKFSVPVRTTQTRNLTIVNDDNIVWNVKVIVSGDFFYADETFSISPKKSHSCSVTYAPLVMNSENNLHNGKVIIELPDGKQPLVYTLIGHSLPPIVVAKITRQLPAKTEYAELLPVHNWLNESQSFSCDIKLVNDPKTNSVLHNFTGNKKLDVPANGTRDFRASFYCYKEAILNFRITFTNNDGEYEFYEVQYKVLKPDVLSTIKLTTPARSSTCYLLQIDNPLENQSINFTAHCQHRDITIQGVPTIVPAKGRENITIEYSPFLPGEEVAKLEVDCAELGNFPYELKLKSTEAPSEKITRIEAILGSSTTFPIVINNPSKRSVEFSIKVDDPSFTCGRSIVIPPQKENILEVTYEPSDAKHISASLHAVSETLGEFIFPLIGSYTLPKPQGPFTIIANSPLNISFKNVFTVTKIFEYVLDGPEEFTIATSSATIESKKIATIVVKFRSSDDSLERLRGEQYPVTGKLSVFSNEPAFSHIVWVYYLKGVRQ